MSEYYFPSVGPNGWICPKCGRCFEPHVDQCPYCGSGDVVMTGATVGNMPAADFISATNKIVETIERRTKDESK